MDYQVKYIEYQGIVEDMIFVFDDNYHVLTEFLGDVDSFSKEYLEIFDKVLSGETEKDSASGNACSFEVDKENTVIEFLYSEDEENPDTCTVNTKELRALMDEWLRKRAEFLQSR